MFVCLAAAAPLGMPSGKIGHHPGWKSLQGSAAIMSQAGLQARAGSPDPLRGTCSGSRRPLRLTGVRVQRWVRQRGPGHLPHLACGPVRCRVRVVRGCGAWSTHATHGRAHATTTVHRKLKRKWPLCERAARASRASLVCPSRKPWWGGGSGDPRGLIVNVVPGPRGAQMSPDPGPTPGRPVAG